MKNIMDMKIGIKTMISPLLSIDQCRKNPKTLFIFGDNNLRQGMGGTACIRDEINAIGVATKKEPSYLEGSFFDDDELELNKSYIDGDIQRIKDYAQEIEVKQIAFPQNGLGTGLSQMQSRCPLTFCYLTQELIKHFKFNNLEKLKT